MVNMKRKISLICAITITSIAFAYNNTYAIVVGIAEGSNDSVCQPQHGTRHAYLFQIDVHVFGRTSGV